MNDQNKPREAECDYENLPSPQKTAELLAKAAGITGEFELPF